MALRNQPYFPLYVQDYLTDEKLSSCSASTQGVYIKILCIFHKSETYGGILFKQKDKQTTNTVLNFACKFAKLLSFDAETIKNALEELLEENVLTIDNDFIYQKRMVKDGNISISRALAGKKGGGNPNLKKVDNDVLLKQNPKQTDKQNHKQNPEYENANVCIDNTQDNNINSLNTNTTITKSIKEKKISEKPKKSKNLKFVPPELLDVETYFLENSFTKELAMRFFKGYNESNWSDQRGNKIHNWKLKAQNVWFVNNDKFRITEGVQKLGKKSVLQTAEEAVEGALNLLYGNHGTDKNIE